MTAPLPSTPSREPRARAVATNGVGQHTSAHLNLTRSLADTKRKAPTWKPEPGKQPYAGYDDADRGWRK